MELPRKKTDISQTLALMWEIFDGFTYAVLSGNGAVYITLCLMIRLRCPACGYSISALSDEWQRQRGVNQKRCPSCGAKVVFQFNLARFLGWFGLFMGVAVFAAYVFGPAGFAWCFAPAWPATMFLSAELRHEA
jgi:hypothetical protein